MSHALGVFICSHIFNDTLPILLVAREDGDWMYMCGQVHDEQDEGQLAGLEHLLERDATLSEIQDLPDNSEAERSSPGAPWIRRALRGD